MNNRHKFLFFSGRVQTITNFEPKIFFVAHFYSQINILGFSFLCSTFVFCKLSFGTVKFLFPKLKQNNQFHPQMKEL